MTAEKLIYHINPPKHLVVLIAYTVASDVLHIFEEKCPNYLRPRKALDLVKRYLDGEDVSKEELKSAASAAAYDAAAYDAANAAAYAAAAAYTAAVAAAAADAAYTAAYLATNAALWAAKATSDEHVIKLIYSMMPKLIDYAIKNQVRLFTGPGDFSEVFDKLDDTTRGKVIWNMELFG